MDFLMKTLNILEKAMIAVAEIDPGQEPSIREDLGDLRLMRHQIEKASGKAKVETSDSGLNIPCVTQQRELFYNFITWYNAKPKIERPANGLITVTTIDEFLKL